MKFFQATKRRCMFRKINQSRVRASEMTSPAWLLVRHAAPYGGNFTNWPIPAILNWMKFFHATKRRCMFQKINQSSGRASFMTTSVQCWSGIQRRVAGIFWINRFPPFRPTRFFHATPLCCMFEKSTNYGWGRQKWRHPFRIHWSGMQRRVAGIFQTNWFPPKFRLRGYLGL